MALRSRSPKPIDSTAAPTPSGFQPRPFSPPAPAATPLTPAELQAGIEHAQRSGHNLANFALTRPPSAPPLVQPKLTIGAPGDPYEQEADRVATQVMQRLQFPQVGSPQGQNSVQREILSDEDELHLKPDTLQRETEPDEDEELQMKPLLQRQAAPGAASAELERGIQQSRGRGQSLAVSIRQPMEQAFGNVDFSGVNIHTDSQADRLNRSIQARAFTTGQDIYFRQGAYQPGSRGGQELIAHELTHVVQQSGGIGKSWAQQGGGADIKRESTRDDLKNNSSAYPDQGIHIQREIELYEEANQFKRDSSGLIYYRGYKQLFQDTETQKFYVKREQQKNLDEISYQEVSFVKNDSVMNRGEPVAQFKEVSGSTITVQNPSRFHKSWFKAKGVTFGDGYMMYPQSSYPHLTVDYEMDGDVVLLSNAHYSTERNDNARISYKVKIKSNDDYGYKDIEWVRETGTGTVSPTTATTAKQMMEAVAKMVGGKVSG